MISTKHSNRESIDGRQATAEAPSSRVVEKPIPASQHRDPRKYQLDQIKRRFSPTLGTLRNGTTTARFHLKPSDPDFPFELERLDCELQVPAAYPQEPPTLLVKNQDIPRGFCVNIERGWDKLVSDRHNATLLALVTALDKNLEAFLSEQKAETVTLVSFKDTRHLEHATTSLGGEVSALISQVAPLKSPTPPQKTYVPEESFTGEQIAGAKARRAQEIRQLEARMGRIALYQKSADGVVYTIPLEPRRRTELPQGLQSIKSVQLIIPLLYPLQALRILLNDVESQDAEPLEEAFATRVVQQKHMTLMNHLNYLSQNMHTMAKQAQVTKSTQLVPESSLMANGQTSKVPEIEESSALDRADAKGHIHIIPRPPEWSRVPESDDSNSDSDFWGSSEDSEEGGADIELQQPRVSGAAQQVERGTAISFPTVELYGIELLQVSILNISSKCQRCKTLNDITSLKPGAEKAINCRKCGSPATAMFRQEMVHQNSSRAGFIDVTGCTVADMLPSTFVPTCSKCSTPSQGLVSVRGEAVTNVCRECHGRFTFKIPQVKFLAITAGSALPPALGPRRRQEKLGLHAGEPLPGRGACQHYRRSYRWFRFSCCSKVHPCDKCHDENEDHIQEWANRMICGWCSREQNYAVEACTFCGRSVIGKKGRGFWEGGKGTRDKVKMSRKDKRKFRRVGGGEAKKKD
ncbi:hypothetical protein F5B22DRAFT_640553 [Xylaria bambusicola]|uniref:uncharacterized protein n=1 Tax=Xylaria bambusicola TaxID=326684 RepID=UPI002008A093|nr:uncharacterized protein F5B22DRAFT_640553 [Xylaria bambusicola]KAI0502896.1 hypothetical protein F5B22DRAFT_640553 [Xylaria bambusicola]